MTAAAHCRSVSTRSPSIVLVVASCAHLGGQGLQAQTLQEELTAEGYRVDLLPIDPPFAKSLAWLRAIPYLRTIANQALYIPSLRRLRDSDVVHVYCASYASFLLSAAPALVAARLFSKRVVLNYHSGEAEDHLRRWGIAVHPWLRLADAIVVPSVYLHDVFARHGYTARMIPNVIDLSRFRFRERTELRPAFLSSRNFEPYYAIDDVLRAYAAIEAQRPDASLVVVGSGHLDAQLRSLARSLRLRRVRFLGRVEHDAMPKVYDDADIMLNASVVDNQPLSVLEAFACGLSVVSTPTGELATMVRDGETGCIVPPRDPGAMARAALDLLAHPRRAALMARQARQSLGRHRWSSVRNDWSEIYLGAGA